ncbi:hypothetical protein STENM36S_06080 [Streptomyces tendae]
MNLELSEEQTAVRQLARDFVEREIAPHVVEWDRAEEVRTGGIVKKLGECSASSTTARSTSEFDVPDVQGRPRSPCCRSGSTRRPLVQR